LHCHLKAAIKAGRSIGEAAVFLCRANSATMSRANALSWD
jgi:hypothetical protein